MSNRCARGRTYAHIHGGGKWLSERMRSISALQHRQWYRRISCAYSTTSVFPNRVTNIFRQTSQSWCVGIIRPRTNSGCHRVTYTSAHRRHKSVQRVPQRRQSVQKSPLYTNSGGILPVIQEQVHQVRELTMSQNSVTLMEYVRGITRL